MSEGRAAPGAHVVSEDLELEAHLAHPPITAARNATRNGLVIVHDLTLTPGGATSGASTFAELADRVAQDTGWAALAFSHRGVGRSPGRFSPGGWLRDLQAAVAALRAEAGSVWIAGFGFGGTLALRAAALDPEIGGVAALATPTELWEWIRDPKALAATLHEAGVSPAPELVDLGAWAEELRDLDPLGSAAEIPPRPLLIVHGSADDRVPIVDARALADAADGSGELRVIAMAGIRLRHDPRAIALLLGWLERNEN